MSIYPCQYCRGFHSLNQICPRIEKIEYYPDGTTKSVTLRPLLLPQQPEKNDLASDYDALLSENAELKKQYTNLFDEWSALSQDDGKKDREIDELKKQLARTATAAYRQAPDAES